MILGISGLANSGKDTVADILVRERAFMKISLADPLKRIVRDVYDFSVDQLWGPSGNRNAPDLRYPRDHSFRMNEKTSRHECACCGFEWMDRGERPPQCYLTPRYSLQALGTEYGRHLYKNTWVDLCLRTANQVLKHGAFYTQQEGLRRRHDGDPRVNGVAIPDMRFWNEIEAIDAAEGRTVRVSRQSAGLKGSAGLHKSEQEQLEIPDEKFSIVLLNEGTLDQLRKLTLFSFPE